MIPGAWDDEGKAVVEILDAEGSLVDRYETFDAAVAAVESGQTIKLVKNTTVAGKLNIDVAVELDLNGCTLTGTNTVYSFGFKGDGMSRVFDSSADKSGKIVNAASRALVIDGPGVEVVLDDVTIEAGLYVAQVSNAAQVTLRGGTYTGGDSAFAMYGTQNETDKDKPTMIIVEDDAVLTGGASYAVSSNGNAKYLGPVNIYVNGGELISKGVDGGAVYMPTHGEFVMTDGYLEGAQGVQICDGATVKIFGGAIKATNSNTIDNPSKQGDGIVEDGAALSIVSRGGGYGVAGSATVEVTGGTFEAAANPAIREYGFGDIAGSLVRDMSISGNAVVTNLKSGAPVVELALLEGDAAKVISGGWVSLVAAWGRKPDVVGRGVVHRARCPLQRFDVSLCIVCGRAGRIIACRIIEALCSVFRMVKGRRQMKALIPAAGLGTRFLPATKAQPKEMLLVVDRPAIQYVVEEGLASAADEVVIINSHEKKAIEDHFSPNPELVALLRERGKDKYADVVEKVGNYNVSYVYQEEALGLGHAVRCAAEKTGDEPFYVLLGDVLVPDNKMLPAMQEVSDAHGGASVIAVMPVPDEEVSRFGVIAGEAVSDDVWKIDSLVEKPALEDAPSNLAVFGRYLLSPRVMELLADVEPGVGGEIQLTDALDAVLKEEEMYALIIDPADGFDTGTVESWLETNNILWKRAQGK